MKLALEGRIALVTGAAGGIGRAIALALAEAGADVALHDRERSPSLSAAAAAVEALGRCAISVIGDVRDMDAVTIFVQETVTHFGKLDILVNNAGVMTEISMRCLDVDVWRETIESNLTGCFLCTRAAAEHMIARKTGSIINIASQLAYRGGVGLTHYSAAKAGILGFTRAAARELAEHGIRVNAVAPGPIETELIARYQSPEWLDAKFAASVLKRLGRPDEVEGASSFSHPTPPRSTLVRRFHPMVVE
jgi:3-oxoacyl-[acyl-carrier protein] reductase